MELGLKNRIAFVTGASRGMGHAIAMGFAREGVKLALFGRDIQLCEDLARELRTQYPTLCVIVVALDLEQPETIKPAVEEAVRKLGGVDILVNCAGGSYRGQVSDVPDDAWERYFKVKPLGLIRMTRESLPYLKRSSHGRVINISGIRGREPTPHSLMGGAINSCTLNVTKAFATEFGPCGITVNVIVPGATQTRRWADLVARTARDLNVSEDDAKKSILREVPLGRVALPEDIADLALFLASDRAGMITGASINVDGGRTHSM